jgi:hypothetical protein
MTWFFDLNRFQAIAHAIGAVACIYAMASFKFCRSGIRPPAVRFANVTARL